MYHLLLNVIRHSHATFTPLDFEDIFKNIGKRGKHNIPFSHLTSSKLQHLTGRGGGGGGVGVTSIHNKRGCAIFTKKVVPKNLGNRNARLSFYVRKFTTQTRKSLISTPHLSFIYFILGFYTYLQNKRMRRCGVAPPTNNFRKT